MARISDNELEAIKTANDKITKIRTELRIAELEANNIVLQVFCNYGLKPGVDNILSTGEIEYAKKAEEAQQVLPLES